MRRPFMTADFLAAKGLPEVLMSAEMLMADPAGTLALVAGSFSAPEPASSHDLASAAASASAMAALF